MDGLWDNRWIAAFKAWWAVNWTHTREFRSLEALFWEYGYVVTFQNQADASEVWFRCGKILSALMASPLLLKVPKLVLMLQAQ